MKSGETKGVHHEQIAVLRSGGLRLDEPAQKRGQAASAEVVKARP